MERRNNKFTYWVEEFEKRRRLIFGCYYPDDVDDADDELMRQKQVEYLKGFLDLSNYGKLEIIIRSVFDADDTMKKVKTVWDYHQIEKPQGVLFEKSYRFDKGKTLFCTVDLINDSPDMVVKGHDILFLAPKQVDLQSLSLNCFQEFKKHNYDPYYAEKYTEMFFEIARNVSNSYLIVNYGMIDCRVVKKFPLGIGTLYASEIFGDFS
jgi:hypothetical protein